MTATAEQQTICWDPRTGLAGSCLSEPPQLPPGPTGTAVHRLSPLHFPAPPSASSCSPGARAARQRTRHGRREAGALVSVRSTGALQTAVRPAGSWPSAPPAATQRLEQGVVGVPAATDPSTGGGLAAAGAVVAVQGSAAVAGEQVTAAVAGEVVAARHLPTPVRSGCRCCSPSRS